MDSLVRPRTASPHSPPIKHGRSLSPRSVMVEYDFRDDESGDSQELQHLQQPLDYDDYFRDCVVGSEKESADHRPFLDSKRKQSPRNNKRKLFLTDLVPRSVVNLRHRQISNETTEWLASFSSNSVTNTHQISDIDDNDHSFTPQPILPLSSATTRKEHMASMTATVRQPVEELWLGPVFESSQTVLTAITSVPASVTHLDLDLRNALHLLPQAMPLLFGKRHLRTLSLRVYGDAGAVELAKWMNHNPNLERLDLRENRIGSMGARTIVDAIMGRNSSINDSVRVGRPLQNNLTHLNLSCNCILHGDMVGELLAANTSLESLDLGFNWLGNEEIEGICTGLCKNTSLKELNLYGCHRISHTGMKTILRCLRNHNTSLRKICLQAFDAEGKRVIEEINYWLKLNKAGRYLIKSHLASSSSVSLDDDGVERNDSQPCHYIDRKPAPTGIWPRVLEKSNQDPDSIFHLVREGFGARGINFR